MVKINKYSVIIPTNDKRNFLNEVIKNIKISFPINTDIIVKHLKDYPSVLPKFNFLTRECYAKTTGKFIILSADDILFSKNYTKEMDKNKGYKIYFPKLVHPSGYVVCGSKDERYETAIIERKTFEKYKYLLEPDKIKNPKYFSDVSNFVFQIREHEKCLYLKNTYVLHLGFPFCDKGDNSTIVDYLTLKRYYETWLDKQVKKYNEKVDMKIFSGFENIKVDKPFEHTQKIIVRDIPVSKIRIHKLKILMFKPPVVK